LIINEDKDVPN